MNTPLRALVIAATSADVAALRVTLRSLGFEPELREVADLGALRMALSGAPWDAILASDSPGVMETADAVRLCKELSVNISLMVFTAQGMRSSTDAQRRQLKLMLNDALAQRATGGSPLPPLPTAEMFRLLVEESNVGVYLIQNDRFIYANRRLQEITGHSGEALLALPSFLALTPPENRPPVLEPAQPHRPDGVRQVRSVRRCRRGDGVIIDIEITGADTLVNGMPAQLGTVSDVTERRAAEAELRLALALQRSVLEATADGILVINLKGRVAVHNRRFAELWNIPEELFSVGEDKALLDHVLGQLRDPGAFIERVQALYRDPKAVTHDLIEFRDGRIYERYTQPYLLDGITAGRVWSFRDITERERALEQIKYSLVLLKSILESTADGLLVVNRSGAVIEYNQRFMQLWRVPRSVLQSRERDALVQFAAAQMTDPEGFIGKVQQYRDDPETELFDILEFADGRVFERFSIPYRVSGLSQGRVWSFRDITARRLAEASLRIEREIISESPVVISRVQLYPQLKTEYISDNIRLWGYEPEDFYTGRISHRDMLFRDDLERQINESQNYNNAGTTQFVQEYRVVTRNGQARWVYDQTTFRRNAQGVVTHTDFSWLDITERKMSEAGLAVALQRLRTHIDNTPLAVIEWSTDLKVVSWNPAAESLFGTPERAARGRDAAFLMTGGSLQRMRELTAVMARGGKVENPTLENFAADGRVITCRWFNTPLVNAEGRIYGIASLVQDLSELLRTQRELEEFIFTTTHDLKSPLLSLRGFAKLAGEFASDDRLRDMLGRISANADRMDTLIGGVLDYARLGYRQRDEAWTDISALARRMIEELVPIADRPHTEIVGAAEDPWEALMDPVDLERLIGNLFANAQTYRHPDRPLRIRCGMRRGERENHGMIGLYLSDNGIGIPEHEHQYIFRLFTRLQRDDPKRDGHGLGLAIVKRLAEDYGGRVTVESQAEGACFTIWLPRSRFRRLQK